MKSKSPDYLFAPFSSMHKQAKSGRNFRSWSTTDPCDSPSHVCHVSPSSGMGGVEAESQREGSDQSWGNNGIAGDNVNNGIMCLGTRKRTPGCPRAQPSWAEGRAWLSAGCWRLEGPRLGAQPKACPREGGLGRHRCLQALLAFSSYSTGGRGV